MTDNDDCVRFSHIDTRSGHVFGRATLNVPATLNALSQPMIGRLRPQLDAWASDPQVAGVVLDAAGDKAFCAGGDVVALRNAVLASPQQVPAEIAAFFEQEYRVDHHIHTYPKPLLCWGHGIAMGGGLGLLAGASHRVVTPKSRLAMPEISIGLYPDVGGSWFLNRMPGQTGLFAALTGASLNAADALFAGLADFALQHEDQAAVLDAIAASSWRMAQDADAAQLSHLLASHSIEASLPPSLLRTHFDRINALMGHDALADIALRLHAATADADPWLAQAAATFAKGSPTSAAVSHAMLKRTQHMSLAEVFRAEYHASCGCCLHPDLAEGVRAVLVDKDKRPRWQPATLAEVSDAQVDALLAPRFSGPHPLADLR